jgi:hypothetical protein
MDISAAAFYEIVPRYGMIGNAVYC